MIDDRRRTDGDTGLVPAGASEAVRDDDLDRTYTDVQAYPLTNVNPKT